MSPLSPAPNRQTSSRTQFAIDVDRRLSEENRLTIEANALADWMNSQGLGVDLAAADAKAQKEAAQAAAVTANQRAVAAGEYADSSLTYRNAANQSAQTAASAAGAAAGAAGDAEVFKGQAGQEADRAETEADRAKEEADRAASIVGVDVVQSPTDTTPGRVLNVGWMGFGGNSPSYTGNLNDINYNVKVYAEGATSDPGGVHYGWVEHSEITPGHFSFQTAYTVSGDINFRSLNFGVWGGWNPIWTGKNQFAIGPTKETARAALGISGNAKFIDLGAVDNGSSIKTADLSQAEFFGMSMQASNATGTLTIDFINIPTPADEVVTWQVEILRGGQKTIAFRVGGVAITPQWSGTTPPTLTNVSGTRDLIQFYRMPGRSTVYAMLGDEGNV